MATNLYDTGYGGGLFGQPKPRKPRAAGANPAYSNTLFPPAEGANPASTFAAATMAAPSLQTARAGPVGASPTPQPGAASPMAPTNPFTSPLGRAPVPPLGQGGPMRIQDLQKRTGRFLLNDARRANPYLWSALQQLLGQANTNRMSDPLRAAFLGPRSEAIDQNFGQSENNLPRLLGERGLGDSSGLAAGLGQLETGRGEARAGLVSNLYQTEDQRQLDAQGQVRQLLMALLGQAAPGAGILGQARGQNLQQEQIDNANRPDLGSLLGGALGGLGGLFGGGGLGSLMSLFGGGGGAPAQNPAIYKTGWENYPGY